LKDKEDSFATYVGIGKAKDTPNAGAKNTCAVCGKNVYLTEKIEADNKTYHKTCFRCAHCNNIIKLGNFAALNGKLYCKPHFKQLFASKGNYNEGFGKQKLTHEWAARKGPGEDGDYDDEEEEEAVEQEKIVPVKSNPVPAPAKSQPKEAVTAATPPLEAAKASPQKKSDISSIYSSIVTKDKAPASKSAGGNKDVLKSTLFDSDEEDDALFAK